MNRFSSLALCAALGLASFAASAADVDAALSSTNAAGANNLGNTLQNNFYSPPQLPFTESVTTFHGQPVATAGPAIATPAVWRCAKAGTGAAVQLRDFAASLALGGDDASICVTAFKGAVVENTEKLTGNSYVVAKAIICQDDDIANAYEATETRKCDAPIKTEARKARWAREQQVQAVLDGGSQPVGLSADPLIRQRQLAASN